MDTEQDTELDPKAERIRLLMEHRGLDPKLIIDPKNGSQASPAKLRQVARNSEFQAKSLAEMVENHRANGNVLEAEVAKAELDYEVVQADLLNSLAAAIPQITEDSSLEALEAKFDAFAAALATRGHLNQQADLQRRHYLGATIATEIGPELRNRGFTPEETAITVKAISDNLADLTHAASNSNIATLDDQARQAVANFKASGFSYPQEPGLDASQQKIRTAVYAARGCMLEQDANGKSEITTQSGDPVYDVEMNESIAAATKHVSEHGAESVMGDQALSRGKDVQKSLRERSEALAAEVAAAPVLDAPVVNQTQSKRPSVREILRGAADRVSSAAGTLKATVTNKVNQFNLDRLTKQIDKRGSHLTSLQAARKGLDVPADRTQRDQELQKLQARYDPSRMSSDKQITDANRIELLKTANKLDDRIKKNIKKIDGMKVNKQALAMKVEPRAHQNENVGKQGHRSSAKI
jgi:hypothetical protein